METRRVFLAGLFLAGVSAGFAGDPIRTQKPPSIPPPRHGEESDEDSAKSPSADKKILENNDKDMKKKVDRLYQLATELKGEVDSTDSSKVLSLNLMKKAEEIEKLARDIKNRSKG